ncbi:DUF305 domain-containing protein [Streptomyces antibioticus]|uniref:DUF305 domain-containing protein n=1 Tax=Streptomyces antibioticus TaxID=1890 RepID=UPI00225582B2|nr:DUF305 domain-containing protein [Streptomyces antibioticus]MCX5173864.1 DUF305 domain-containing protein [Streptomyces antibioticus]
MNTTPLRARRAALATAIAAVAALSLAACGDDGNSGATSAPPPATATAPATVPAGDHNQADVTFAQGMIPHHRQAILMSEMVQAHASSDEVKALAEKIKKAQEPEIATMSAWLKAWGEKVPTGMDGMDGGDHDGSGMPGMMDNQRMDMLRGASGTAFDTMFLTMMIEHHEGAVEMAKTEKAEGAYGPAKTLADDIITSQTAEIAQMKTMLGSKS